ncbi:MAG: hypothetical protein EXR99_13050 [Gemmataceae bacterium]|nr:hypothetical protein [Gemmataceae bacterium]
MSRLGFLLALLGFLPVIGCGGPLTTRLPVKGNITFKGQPLAHGNIQFLTTQGAPGPAAGAMVKEGKYEIPQLQGLDPGTYKVIISCTEEMKVPPKGWKATSLPTKELLPPEFSSHEKSKNKINVTKDGDNKFDFSIP